MTPNEKQFSAICYLVLMNHHKTGIENAHPNYVEEKLILLNAGYGAWNYLDRENQKYVLLFLLKWNYQVPEEIKKKK